MSSGKSSLSVVQMIIKEIKHVLVIFLVKLIRIEMIRSTRVNYSYS